MATSSNKGASIATSMFGRHRSELHRYLRRRLRQPEDIDDLAQEIYLRLLRVDEETFVREPLAYVYGIAAHVLADFRTDANHEREHLTVDSEALEDWSDKPSAVLPDDLADRLNLQQQIERAIAKLPRTHAAVLLAHKQEGLSYEEVAEKLGLSIHTVEKYVTQAKAQIRMMVWER